MNTTDTNRDVIVRDATIMDMASIREIYAQEVLHGLATFEETPPSETEMLKRRQNVLELGLPYLVAEVEGRLAGYSYATAYRPRPAYCNTVEDSVYVAQEMRGLGVGRKLLDSLITRCEEGGWRQMIAVIGNTGNTGSIKLHETRGFESVGTLKAVGFKLDRWVDTVLMQRKLGPGGDLMPGK